VFGYNKVLVTGGTGFIGSFLVKSLLKSGKPIRCLVRDRERGGLLERSGIEIRYGDILQPETLCGIADDIEVVIHCAALGHVSSRSKADFDEFYKINVIGSLNLAGEALKSRVKKFIQVSSTAAMGLIEGQIASEDTPCNPTTPYQKSKFLAERKLMDFSKEKGLPLLILRPCMVYGPFGGGELLRWCKAMKKGLFPRVGSGKNLSPFIHIDDLVSGIILAVEKGRTGEIYLLTSDESFDMNMVTKIMAEELRIKFVPRIPTTILLVSSYLIEMMAVVWRFRPPVTVQNIKSMATDRLFDISKAKKELGFSPQYPIEKGLRETIRFYLDSGFL